jgi:hypothetical protein
MALLGFLLNEVPTKIRYVGQALRQMMGLVDVSSSQMPHELAS